MEQYLPFVFSNLFNGYNLVLTLAGTIIGIIFGAIPGLSGSLAMMLFMPLTYHMALGPGVMFLISLWVGGCSGAFIGSVLLGIPGSPSSVATVFDGYPMAKKGQASHALAIGMVASFIGTFFSAILGALLAQSIAAIAFKLGPWEYFSLCMVAITMVIAISKGDMCKGLASACIGLLFASVGFSPIDAQERFVFGNMYLMSGLSLTVVLISIFGISRIALEYGRGFDKLPDVDDSSLKGFGLHWLEIVEQGVNIIRSFLIGLVIGFLPGMGAGLSNLVAYSTCKNHSKRAGEFGTGVPDGIWASEVSNNAAIGGAMIPMVSLGIPGDTSTALLIGALSVQGLEMGPMVFRNSGNLVYMMFAAVAFDAVLVLLIQMASKRWFPYILKVPYHYMYPALLVISLVSAYVESGSLYKCGMMIVFAVIGLLMLFAGLPSAPMMLAFILGPTLESNMLKGFQSSDNGIATFFMRPVSCCFLVVAIGCIFSPVLRMLFQRRREVADEACD